MMISKSSKGFTLIETILAIAVMGLVLSPLFITQGTLVQSVARMSRRLGRIFYAKNFMLTARRSTQSDSGQRTVEKKIEDPETTLVYQTKKIGSNSTLESHDLFLETVALRWQEDAQPRDDMLLTMLFKPQHKKKSS